MIKFEKYFRTIGATLDWIGGLILLPAMSIIVLLDVFLRYGFNSPLIWGMEFTEYALLLVFIFAIPACTQNHGHVRMELVIGNVGPYKQKLMSLFYCFSGIFIFFLLARYSWEEFIFDFSLGRITEYLSLPVWFHTLGMFIISVLLIIYFVLRIISVFIKTEAFTHIENNTFGD
jgi:TRAP-type C4-dicarboxylate transport system permease small subunit